MLTTKKLAEVLEAFQIGTAELKNIAAALRYDIEARLRGAEGSTLAMLPSYAGRPTGKEQGRFLALDFGGTNVRAECIRLSGDGRFAVEKHAARPLVLPGEYDYTKGVDAEQLFDFLAALVAEALPALAAGEEIRLGHTFSFPSTQTELGRARLNFWTKEFNVAGVVGEDVNGLLEAALKRRGLGAVRPVAVINDTTAVLLAASLGYGGSVSIGSIYATGHNTCSLERFEDARPPMIYNLESGGFGKLAPNRFDVALDKKSEQPGEQRLEKMVAGKYLGELFALAWAEAAGSAPTRAVSTADMARLAGGDAALAAELCGTANEKAEDISEAMGKLAEAILCRSARLVAASYVGILWHQAGNAPLLPQYIAIDGSLYQHVPIVREALNRALSEMLGPEAGKITPVHCGGGSCLGAAVAAAL